MALGWVSFVGFALALVAADNAIPQAAPSPAAAPAADMTAEQKYHKSLDEAHASAASLETAVKDIQSTASDDSRIAALGNNILKASGSRQDIKAVLDAEQQAKTAMRGMRQDARTSARTAKHWAREAKQESKRAGDRQNVYEKKFEKREEYTEALAEHVENLGEKGKSYIERVYGHIKKRFERQRAVLERQQEAKERAAEEKAAAAERSKASAQASTAAAPKASVQEKPSPCALSEEKGKSVSGAQTLASTSSRGLMVLAACVSLGAFAAAMNAYRRKQSQVEDSKDYFYLIA